MNVITINNLAAQICETDLTKLFAPFGGIIRIKLTRKHDQKTRSIEGIAQVIFVSSESAIAATRHMHGYMLMGRQLIIRQDAPLPKTSQPSQGVKNSIHVRFTTSNIEQTVSKMDLMRIFSPFGDINDVVIKASSIDHLAHHQSGYGFVDFCNRPEGLAAAVKAVQAIHNRCIDGINFHVELSRNILKRLEVPQPVQHSTQYYHSQPAATNHTGMFYPSPMAHSSYGDSHSSAYPAPHPTTYPPSHSPYPVYHYPSGAASPQGRQQLPVQSANYGYSQGYIADQQMCMGGYPQYNTLRPPRPTSQVSNSYEGMAPSHLSSPSLHGASVLTSDRLQKHNNEQASQSSHYSAHRAPSMNPSVPSVIQSAHQTGDNNSVSSVSSRTTVVSADYQFAQASSPSLLPQASAVSSLHGANGESSSSKLGHMLGWTAKVSTSTPAMHSSPLPMTSSSSSHAWVTTKGGMYISEDRLDDGEAFNLSKFTLSILSFDHAI